MRVGFFGGSFDPLHLGHLNLARELQIFAELDSVVFVPARRSPHKLHRKSASGSHRADMVQLATASESCFSVDRRELSRTGPSYTIDTMLEIRKERPNDDLFFLIGMDSVASLSTWHRIDELAKLVTFLIAVRPGYAFEEGAKDLASASISHLHFETKGVDVSSTEVRRRIAQGLSTEGLIPESVEAYIREQNLYKTTY